MQVFFDILPSFSFSLGKFSKLFGVLLVIVPAEVPKKTSKIVSLCILESSDVYEQYQSNDELTTGASKMSYSLLVWKVANEIWKIDKTSMYLFLKHL